MATYILIPGGWQGAWAYETVAALLSAKGHAAVPITLAGLGEERAPTANLRTHITEVVEVVRSHRDGVILVGHSYAGMVLSGVADAVPSHVRASVYVDAYVPDAGDSMWSLTTPHFRELIAAGAQTDGLNITPPAHSDARFRPHPIGSFLQAIDLCGHWRQVPRKIYVCAHGWEGSPFLSVFTRLRAEPDWETFALACGHNIARLDPEALVEILLLAQA
jgi:pimeloyl-ACP methyl ester carboxylesterase